MTARRRRQFVLRATRSKHVAADPRRVVEHLQSMDAYFKGRLKKMVEVNSWTENAAGIAEVARQTRELFLPLGFNEATTIQALDHPSYGEHLFLHKPSKMLHGRGASRRKPVPAVALTSHLDTVFPAEIEAKNDFMWREGPDGFIRGPGVVDIKGGTVAIAMTLEAVRTIDPELYDNTSWHLWFDAAEEQMAASFADACRDQVRAREEVRAMMVFEFDLSQGAGGDGAQAATAALAGDDDSTPGASSGVGIAQNDDERLESESREVGAKHPQEKFHIVCERKGMCIWRVDISGREAHAGNLHSHGRSAIHAAADLVYHLKSLTDYSKRLTFNVGKISGGTAINTVPGHTELMIEMRAPDMDVFDEAKRKFDEYCAAYRHDDMEELPSPISPTVVAMMTPWEPNPGSDWVFSHYERAAAQLGYSVVKQVRGGLSDGNRLWQDFPTVDACGPPGAHPHCAVQDPAHGKFQEVINWPKAAPKAALNALAIISLLSDTSRVGSS